MILNRLCVVSVFMILLSIPLRAGTMLFTLENLTFSDGGTALGTFTWNSDANTALHWNITTTPGTLVKDSYTYSDSILGQGQIPLGMSYEIYLLGEERLHQLLFQFNSPSGLHTGVNISFWPSAEYGQFSRSVVSGSIFGVSVPEPSFFVLLSMGLLAVGIWVSFLQARLRRNTGQEI